MVRINLESVQPLLCCVGGAARRRRGPQLVDNHSFLVGGELMLRVRREWQSRMSRVWRGALALQAFWDVLIVSQLLMMIFRYGRASHTLTALLSAPVQTFVQSPSQPPYPTLPHR